MKTSINRMNAIFKKDFKDLMKNMFISSSMLTPIVLAFFYARVANITTELVFLIVNLTFVVVAFMIQCSIIAEEKEKNTLRGLMLSPASILEILAGKSALSFIMSSITILISVKVMGYVPGNSLLMISIIGISILFYIVLGTLFGLLTNSVMQASVLGMPVMLIFGFGNLFEGFAAKNNISFLVDYLPNMQIINIARMDESGTTLQAVLPHILIILVWLIITSIVAVFIFKKKEMNE